MAGLPRPLTPHLNAPGLLAAAGAVYAAAVMCYNAYYHHGVLSTPVLVAGVAALGSLLTRFVVTPVADPRDGAGRPLVPAPAPPPDAGIRVVHAPPQPVGLPAVVFEETPPPAGPEAS